ncbi:hypothetical protein THAOC_22806 [Thalassiosira oceanica]|uniref:MYND-type domain-containing protein n=1 Tax=Thalassiosira oceanica TaxID=159749 RepID=K0SF22_THAOC|nr:hypothetical protein THAOC_22806 [Thalassiosira oceanica]|eukprot:EJK57182.1 hypothetical protein THAOC_22806 [Thalassiosira oceanica]
MMLASIRQQVVANLSLSCSTSSESRRATASSQKPDLRRKDVVAVLHEVSQHRHRRLPAGPDYLGPRHRSADLVARQPDRRAAPLRGVGGHVHRSPGRAVPASTGGPAGRGQVSRQIAHVVVAATVASIERTSPSSRLLRSSSPRHVGRSPVESSRPPLRLQTWGGGGASSPETARRPPARHPAALPRWAGHRPSTARRPSLAAAGRGSTAGGETQRGSAGFSSPPWHGMGDAIPSSAGSVRPVRSSEVSDRFQLRHSLSRGGSGRAVGSKIGFAKDGHVRRPSDPRAGSIRSQRGAAQHNARLTDTRSQVTRPLPRYSTPSVQLVVRGWHPQSTMSCVPVADDGDEACANCGKHGSDTVKLKNCNACRLVKYCGVDCQRAHRKQHKKACKKRAAELRDEELYSQGHERPEGEFCPLCTLPIPLPLGRHSVFEVCCMKTICNGCNMAAQKRGMFDCAFCRTPCPDNDDDKLAMLQARVKKKDPEAIYFLGQKYFFGSLGLQKDTRKAVELFTEAVELGSIDALFSLGNAYFNGDGVQQDKDKGVYFLTKSAMQGHVQCRHNLGQAEARKGNFDRAVKHWMISAKMRYEKSIQNIKREFMKGIATKEQYPRH